MQAWLYYFIACMQVVKKNVSMCRMFVNQSKEMIYVNCIAGVQIFKGYKTRPTKLLRGTLKVPILHHETQVIFFIVFVPLYSLVYIERYLA